MSLEPYFAFVAATAVLISIPAPTGGVQLVFSGCPNAPGSDRDRRLISSSTGRMCWRNKAGFSDIGKWPMPAMTVALEPWMRAAVASVRSGVQEESYSPDRR